MTEVKQIAVELIDAIGKAPNEPVAQSLGGAGQTAALLYVGEQLERIADMIAGGFYVTPGDFGSYSFGPEERR